MPFSSEERTVLLKAKGVGPTVIARLEAQGVESLADLAQRDPGALCAAISGMLGAPCWRNSPQAQAAMRNAVAAARTAVGAEPV